MTFNLDLSPDDEALLSMVPENGSTIGNNRLRNALGWEEERYWRARDALVDRGLVVRGVGHGGTLRRVVERAPIESVSVPVDLDQNAGDAAITVESIIRREEELYEPMAAVLRGAWARDRRTSPLGVEVTARQGRRATGGIWSRPDIVSVQIRAYEYVPGKFLEVDTFEVKPTETVDVQAVYEALAHRRASTRAYVLLHVPTGQETALAESIQNVRLVARSHGIGVVVASNPEDYSTWDELEEALRVEPDPERLNGFIDTQLSERLKRQIAKALR